MVGEGEDENRLIQDATNAIEAAQTHEGENNEPRLAYLSCFIEEEHMLKGMAVIVGAGGAADHSDPSLPNMTNSNSMYEPAPPKQVGGGLTQAISNAMLRKNITGKDSQLPETLVSENPASSKQGGANAHAAQQPEEQLPRQSTRNKNTTRIDYNENNRNEKNSSLGIPVPHAVKNNSAVLPQKLNPHVDRYEQSKSTVIDKSAPSEFAIPFSGNNPLQDDLSSPAVAATTKNANSSHLEKRPAGAMRGAHLDEPHAPDRQVAKKQKVEDRYQRFEEGITKVVESQQ